MWWAKSHRWALDRAQVSPDNEPLLHDALHHFSIWQRMAHFTKHRLTQLRDGEVVTIELAGRGPGPAGSVQVPDNLLAQLTDPRSPLETYAKSIC